VNHPGRTLVRHGRSPTQKLARAIAARASPGSKRSLFRTGRGARLPHGQRPAGL